MFLWNEWTPLWLWINKPNREEIPLLSGLYSHQLHFSHHMIYFFPLNVVIFLRNYSTKISHCVLSFQSVIISVIGQPPILNCCIYRGGEEKHFLKHKSYIIHIAQVISLAILMRRGHGNFSNHIRKPHCSKHCTYMYFVKTSSN